MTPEEFVELKAAQAAGDQVNFEFHGRAVIPFSFTLNLSQARDWKSHIKTRIARRGFSVTLIQLDGVTCTTYNSATRKSLTSSMHFGQWISVGEKVRVVRNK